MKLSTAIAAGLVLFIPVLPSQAQAPPEVQAEISRGKLVRLNLLTTSNFSTYADGSYSIVQNPTAKTVSNITVYYSVLSRSGTKNHQLSISDTLEPREQAQFTLPTSTDSTINITDVVGRPSNYSSGYSPSSTPTRYNPPTSPIPYIPPTPIYTPKPYIPSTPTYTPPGRG